MESKKRYFKELNIFRGLIIIWVVIGHSFVADGTFLGHLTTYAYTFHMSAFFLLSGILFYPKLTRIHNFKDGFSVVLNRFKRLIVPYLFFSIISYILKYFFESYAYNQLSSGFSIIHDLFFGVNNPNGGIWFLHNLFIFSLFAVLLKFIPSIILFLSSSILYVVSFFVDINSDFRSLITFAPYFFFGIFFSKYYGKISEHLLKYLENKSAKNRLYISSVLLGIISVTVFCIYLNFSKDSINAILKLLMCIVNILFWYMISVCLTSNQKLQKPINVIGNYGMDIYMIGYYIQISIRVGLGSILGLPYLFYSMCMLVFGLLLPIPISKYVVRKVKLFRMLMLGDFSKKEKVNGDKKCLKN